MIKKKIFSPVATQSLISTIPSVGFEDLVDIDDGGIGFKGI